MAIELEVPTPTNPFRPQKGAGADAGDLREVMVPWQAGSLTIRVKKSGAKVPFRVQGTGVDGAAEDGNGDPYDAGEWYVYTTDLGQQNRANPALSDWSVFVACDEDAADIHATASLHRNTH